LFLWLLVEMRKREDMKNAPAVSARASFKLFF
jgi:hypothetical protein